MKKILFATMLVMGLIASAIVPSFAQAVTISTNVTTLATAVSTTATTGLLIANTVPNARITEVEISWTVDSATATVALYDSLKGTSSKPLYIVYIPSSTITGTNAIRKTYTQFCPLTAKNGLMAVKTAGSKAVGDIAVNVVWW